jgi:hypothetical protein
MSVLEGGKWWTLPSSLAGPQSEHGYGAEEIIPYCNLSPVVQPIDSRCTDWAIQIVIYFYVHLARLSVAECT